MARYRLDPLFDRTPDGAVKGIIRYDIYLDGHFVGSRRTHAMCHQYLELMPFIPQPACGQALRRRVDSAGVVEGIRYRFHLGRSHAQLCVKHSRTAPETWRPTCKTPPN